MRCCAFQQNRGDEKVGKALLSTDRRCGRLDYFFMDVEYWLSSAKSRGDYEAANEVLKEV